MRPDFGFGKEREVSLSSVSQASRLISALRVVVARHIGTQGPWHPRFSIDSDDMAILFTRSLDATRRFNIAQLAAAKLDAVP